MTDIVELAVVPKETALQVFTTENGLDPYLEKIREVLDAFEPDVSTKNGRDAISSIAHKVSRAKSALDSVGKAVVADLKELPKKVDVERKRVRDTLDLWKDQVRAPLTDWEEAKQARIDKHMANIEHMRVAGVVSLAIEAASLRQTIEQIENVRIDGTWEEYEPEAIRTKDRTLASLRDALAKRETYDAEQAELARLRKEAAERAEQDRIKRIADDAAAAERNRATVAVEKERAAAAQQLADANAATKRAELEREAANKRAEQAAAAERQRQKDADAEVERERKARENDRAHRGRVNGAALIALMDGGLTEACAKTAITLIAMGKVPNICIQY